MTTPAATAGDAEQVVMFGQAKTMESFVATEREQYRWVGDECCLRRPTTTAVVAAYNKVSTGRHERVRRMWSRANKRDSIQVRVHGSGPETRQLSYVLGRMVTD